MQIIQRIWAMPNRNTFTIKPIRELIAEVFTGGVWIDPFCGYHSPASHTNDLDPNIPAMYHEDALAWTKRVATSIADGVIYDPPYSITQAVQCYKGFGAGNMGSMKYWADVKNQLARATRLGGIAICCGWSSQGLGLNRGFRMDRLLLVPHGGSKNDTIVTVETKVRN